MLIIGGTLVQCIHIHFKSVNAIFFDKKILVPIENNMTLIRFYFWTPKWYCIINWYFVYYYETSSIL